MVTQMNLETSMEIPRRGLFLFSKFWCILNITILSTLKYYSYIIQTEYSKNSKADDDDDDDDDDGDNDNIIHFIDYYFHVNHQVDCVYVEQIFYFV
jgi:hypothetical protein